MLLAAGASSLKDPAIAALALSKIKEPIDKIIVLKSIGFEAAIVEAALYTQIPTEMQLPVDTDYFTQRDLDINTLLNPDVDSILIVSGRYPSARIRYLHLRAYDLGKKTYYFTLEDLYAQ